MNCVASCFNLHNEITGGATLNSIRVAQWMLGIPGSSAYFGAIGQDKFGEQLGMRDSFGSL